MIFKKKRYPATPQCYFCSRFLSYREMSNHSVNWTPYGGSEDEEPPDAEYHSPCDSGMNYFGVCASKVGDNETGSQYRERVKAKMSKYFSNSNFSYLEESWYNG